MRACATHSAYCVCMNATLLSCIMLHARCPYTLAEDMPTLPDAKTEHYSNLRNAPKVPDIEHQNAAQTATPQKT